MCVLSRFRILETSLPEISGYQVCLWFWHFGRQFGPTQLRSDWELWATGSVVKKFASPALGENQVPTQGEPHINLRHPEWSPMFFSQAFEGLALV